jgi:transposase-like protein
MEKLKGYRFPTEIILLCVRWYLRYSLSLRDLVEIMQERNVDVSYESIRQWILKFGSKYDEVRKKKQPYYTLSWKVDETYIKINKKWYYYYRAIDSHGHVLDFYLSPFRDAVGAEIFLGKCIPTADSKPDKIISDKYDAYPPAIKEVCPETEHVTNKFLNNSLERDHQRVKKRLKPMRGLKNPNTAGVILGGIEGIYELYMDKHSLGLKGIALDEAVYAILTAA